VAQRTVARSARPYVLVALIRSTSRSLHGRLGGRFDVLKSTPPGPKGDKRLTAAIRRSQRPLSTCLSQSSATPIGFPTRPPTSSARTGDLPCNRTTRVLFPSIRSASSGTPASMTRRSSPSATVDSQFIFGVKHADRLVEVYNTACNAGRARTLARTGRLGALSLRLAVTFQHARQPAAPPSTWAGSPCACPIPKRLWPWSPMIETSGARSSCSPTSHRNHPGRRTGLHPKAQSPASNIPTASTKNRASISKTCASTPSNACAASLSWSCSLPCSATQTRCRRG